ncbi:hypothetical protein HYV87_03460 [Candidatus Woesearchaeota archaeon]|nr:hypothetical protein [Candidatus Woesearchaeota archaeon]MBI2582155.1 hypothetical protein [Candidatus Woesearchaeota archaeon]
MEKKLKTIVKTGYGLGLLSLTEAKRVASKVKTELKLNDEESLKLAKQLMANSDKASKEVMGTVGKYFESALLKSGVASKGEVKTVRSLLKKRAQRVKSAMKENLKHLRRRGKK